MFEADQYVVLGFLSFFSILMVCFIVYDIYTWSKDIDLAEYEDTIFMKFMEEKKEEYRSWDHE